MRSGREHCGSQIAVGRGGQGGGRRSGRQEEEEEDEDEDERKRKRKRKRKAADIKSNNPHLAGGEIVGKDSYNDQFLGKSHLFHTINPGFMYNLSMISLNDFPAVALQN